MVRRINLALQGGGAHGAFAWGVLDRLLEEDEIEIAAISGTSAGALNGAGLKAGLSIGGIEGRRAARENLDYIWGQVGEASDNLFMRWVYSVFPTPRHVRRLTEFFSPAAWLDQVTRLVSPYDLGPFYSNPLTAIIRDMPHPKLDRPGGPELFVSATNVRTGRIRVFRDGEITISTILASACLPTIYKAIEIHDPTTGRREAYWDGGYSGNPALFPLYRPELPRDIVIVAINPMTRHKLPRTPGSIQDRINEISFNTALMSELRAIKFVKSLHAEKRMEGREMKNLLIHMIKDERLMNALGASTKMMPGPGLLAKMREAGRAAAGRWIAEGLDCVGDRDSYDLSSLFSLEVG
ncbi:patatin-like phospholipase family protein [Paracoccus aminophilus]|uniref:Esterase n=1 Tax=Paracoccus aminophilus JCM 7686 TaxID=1367847 RepID=S5YT97_PARAH|nr:patatin-like phospholipase family protein [Paracoccus aminophilus]AGT08451.1 esterase [Paracoccus aminophilus JCM 7686]